MPVPAPLKTVLVLGSAYAGHRAVEVLSKALPLNWKIIVMDRSTHFCHIYAFPRISILPGHEQKAFIPLTTTFTRGLSDEQRASGESGRHELIHGCVTGLEERAVRYTPFVTRTQSSGSSTSTTTTTATGSNINTVDGTGIPQRSDDPLSLEEGPEQRIPFDYCIYALGAKYPSPINVWTHQSGIFLREPLPLRAAISEREQHGVHEVNTTAVGVQGKDMAAKGVRETTECTGTKAEGISWMRAAQRRIEETKKILIVGGGALGVQMATDIIATHGLDSKKITLLHSRSHLLNHFAPEMHERTMQRMKEMGIEVILESRVDGEFINQTEGGVVRTVDGREVEADLILWCTGQAPNTSYIQETYPASINPSTRLAYVNRHLRLSRPLAGGSLPASKTDGTNDLKNDDFEVLNDRVFVVGDCADAFGALNAGHTAYWQADLAAENVLSLIRAEEDGKSTSDAEMREYKAPAYGIKVSLGRDLAIYQKDGKTGVADPKYNLDDLGMGIMWSSKELSEDDYFA